MKLFFKGLTEGQVYIDLDGNGTYETYDLNDIQGGLDLDENLDYSKIKVKANSKVFSNLQVIKNFEVQRIECNHELDENGQLGSGGVEGAFNKVMYIETVSIPTSTDSPKTGSFNYQNTDVFVFAIKQKKFIKMSDLEAENYNNIIPETSISSFGLRCFITSLMVFINCDKPSSAKYSH